jgi:hypothetical protein
MKNAKAVVPSSVVPTVTRQLRVALRNWIMAPPFLPRWSCVIVHPAFAK